MSKMTIQLPMSSSETALRVIHALIDNNMSDGPAEIVTSSGIISGDAAKEIIEFLKGLREIATEGLRQNQPSKDSKAA